MSSTLSWLRRNLFSSIFSTIATIVIIIVGSLIIQKLVSWMVVNATWSGGGDACRSNIEGACWPFIGNRLGQFTFGTYPIDERWRVMLVIGLFFVSLGVLALPKIPKNIKYGLTAFMLIPYPIISWFILRGDVFGLTEVPTLYWGGFSITIIVATVGIVASIPLGVLLALGRQSKMPLIRSLSVVFIEFWRGIPLITVLFVAAYILTMFFPPDFSFDLLLRAMIAVSIFTAAYMAEVIRGGLQAIPKGQYEASHSLGLSYWKTTGLIVLPQALKISIPSMVNSFISLFKDTTLLLIISIVDFLGAIHAGTQDAAWGSPTTAYTGYIFAAMVFWVFCFSMSKYSQKLERDLNTEHKNA